MYCNDVGFSLGLGFWASYSFRWSRDFIFCFCILLWLD